VLLASIRSALSWKSKAGARSANQAETEANLHDLSNEIEANSRQSSYQPFSALCRALLDFTRSGVTVSVDGSHGITG
jgi:hypothetical protein